MARATIKINTWQIRQDIAEECNLVDLLNSPGGHSLTKNISDACCCIPSKRQIIAVNCLLVRGYVSSRGPITVSFSKLACAASMRQLRTVNRTFRVRLHLLWKRLRWTSLRKTRNGFWIKNMRAKGKFGILRFTIWLWHITGIRILSPGPSSSQTFTCRELRIRIKLFFHLLQNRELLLLPAYLFPKAMDIHSTFSNWWGVHDNMALRDHSSCIPCRIEKNACLIAPRVASRIK